MEHWCSKMLRNMRDSWVQPLEEPWPQGRGVVWVWARWNGTDNAMLDVLTQCVDVFDAQALWLRGLDFDPELHWPLLRAANVVNLPALILMVDGTPTQTHLGLREPEVIRMLLEDWKG